VPLRHNASLAGTHLLSKPSSKSIGLGTSHVSVCLYTWSSVSDDAVNTSIYCLAPIQFITHLCMCVCIDVCAHTCVHLCHAERSRRTHRLGACGWRKGRHFACFKYVSKYVRISPSHAYPPRVYDTNAHTYTRPYARTHICKCFKWS